ncbi:MAG: DUF2892 domain-containing protein [Bacteroidota bacterium]
MKKNMGNTDRLIRVIIAVAAIGLFFTSFVPKIVSIILLVVAGIFVFTSTVSFCPLYALFGISSCPVKQE